MTEAKSKPFFMYFAINLPHYPYQGDPKWLEYYNKKGLAYPRNLFAAFMSTLDDKIGQLLKKVSDLGLTENTIIVFQSRWCCIDYPVSILWRDQFNANKNTKKGRQCIHYTQLLKYSISWNRFACCCVHWISRDGYKTLFKRLYKVL